MDRDMERLEKLNRAPAAAPQPSGGPSRDLIAGRPPVSAPLPPAIGGSAPPVTATAPAALPPGGSLPTQQTAAPPQPNAPAPAPTTNWGRGGGAVGQAAASGGSGRWPAAPRATFEDDIRRILEEQNRNATSQQAPRWPIPPRRSPARKAACAIRHRAIRKPSRTAKRAPVTWPPRRTTRLSLSNLRRLSTPCPCGAQTPPARPAAKRPRASGASSSKLGRLGACGATPT